MSRLRVLLAASALAVLVGAGCGGGSPSGNGTGRTAAHPRLALPSLKLLEVGSGRQVDLAFYQPKDKALLVWAWAPH